MFSGLRHALPSLFVYRLMSHQIVSLIPKLATGFCCDFGTKHQRSPRHWYLLRASWEVRYYVWLAPQKQTILTGVPGGSVSYQGQNLGRTWRHIKRKPVWPQCRMLFIMVIAESRRGNLPLQPPQSFRADRARCFFWFVLCMVAVVFTPSPSSQHVFFSLPAELLLARTIAGCS